MNTVTKMEVEIEERTVRRELYRQVRKDMNEVAKQSGYKHRYMLLLWAFMREMPFRRVERTHHKQIVNGQEWEHNIPYAPVLLIEWRNYLPSVTREEIDVWLRNPDGAIPPPPSREKQPYKAS